MKTLKTDKKLLFCSFSLETLIPKFSLDSRKVLFFDARETAPLFLSCKPSVSGYKLKW